jgi:hypothetical protein
MDKSDELLYTIMYKKLVKELLKMIEDTKYYIPDISDFYVGYQFKQIWTDTTRDGKVDVDTDFVLISRSIDMGMVQTKYLDQEDIESLGWKLLPDWNSNTKKGFEKDNYWLVVDFSNKPCIVKIIIKDPCILDINDPEFFRVVLPCKSINELRTIDKMINQIPTWK